MLSGVTITTIDSLPDELLFDILVRCPANYLYDRTRLVFRRWRRIIQYSDAFITTHIQQSSSSGLVFSLPSASPPYSIYATATPDGRIETSKFSHICTNTTSANGLVVVYNIKDLQLYVINPATKQSFLLPSVSVPYTSACRSQCGIAYSVAFMEYKVTLPYSTTVEDGVIQHCLDIVTVGVDKSWRRVEIIPPLPNRLRSLLSFYPMSSEGFLHWGSGRYCLTLNVETEIITRTEAPIPGNRRNCYHYLSTGRYLSLLVGRRKELRWEVWEMRPAESGEWRRKAELPDIDFEDKKWRFQKEIAYGDDSNRLVPLGWVKYPEVLAFRFWDPTKTCIFYNLETRQINKIDLPHLPILQSYCA